jgi:hypothetical protein
VLRKRIGRAIRNPSILADLKSDTNSVYFKENISNRDFIIPNSDRLNLTSWPRLKPTWLVVQTISSQILLGYKATEHTINRHRSCVVHHSINKERQAKIYHQSLSLAYELNDARKRFVG